MILKQIYEFEKIISDEESDYLENYVMMLTDWKYYEDINVGEDSQNKKYRPGWVSGMFDNRTKIIINNIKQNALEKLNLIEKKTLRIKINKTPKLHISEKESYSGMHIDGLSLGYKNDLIMIYYINNSTGETLISDLHIDNIKNITELDKKIELGEYTNFNIIKRVEPKKGKLLVFDAGFLHCGQWPKTDYRYVINMNLQVINSKKENTLI